MDRKEFKYIGFWEIIGIKSNNKYYGILTCNNDGIDLEITTDKILKFEEKEFKYIVGRTQTNLEITLIDCSLISYPAMTIPGRLNRYRFNSNIILEGLSIKNKKKKFKFESLNIYYDSISRWITYNPFNTSLDKSFNETINITKMKSQSLQIDSIQSEIVIFNSIGQEYDEHVKVEYKSLFGFEIIPNILQDLDWYLTKCFDLQNILILLTGFYFPVIKLKGNIKEIDKQINIIYRQVNNKGNKYIHPNDINFPFFSINNDLSIILNKWFLIIEQIRPTIDLLFSSTVSNMSYLNFTFLALTQALENFHRIQFSENTYYSIEDFKNINSEVINNLPDDLISDYKSSLLNRIKYSNEFSLRKRMRNLLNELNDDLKLLFMSKTSVKNIDKIINTVVDTRNYYTHYCKEQNSLVIEYSSLYSANMSLIIFLRILLLKQIGLKDDVIYDSYKNKRHYKPFFKILETINIMK